jgi:hypothetical protein
MSLFAIREQVRTAKHDEFVIDRPKVAENQGENGA